MKQISLYLECHEISTTFHMIFFQQELLFHQILLSHQRIPDILYSVLHPYWQTLKKTITSSAIVTKIKHYLSLRSLKPLSALIKSLNLLE